MNDREIKLVLDNIQEQRRRIMQKGESHKQR